VDQNNPKDDKHDEKLSSGQPTQDTPGDLERMPSKDVPKENANVSEGGSVKSRGSKKNVDDRSANVSEGGSVKSRGSKNVDDRSANVSEGGSVKSKGSRDEKTADFRHPTEAESVKSKGTSRDEKAADFPRPNEGERKTSKLTSRDEKNADLPHPTETESVKSRVSSRDEKNAELTHPTETESVKSRVSSRDVSQNEYIRRSNVSDGGRAKSRLESSHNADSHSTHLSAKSKESRLVDRSDGRTSEGARESRTREKTHDWIVFTGF